MWVVGEGRPSSALGPSAASSAGLRVSGLVLHGPLSPPRQVDARGGLGLGGGGLGGVRGVLPPASRARQRLAAARRKGAAGTGLGSPRAARLVCGWKWRCWASEGRRGDGAGAAGGSGVGVQLVWMLRRGVCGRKPGRRRVCWWDAVFGVSFLLFSVLCFRQSRGGRYSTPPHVAEQEHLRVVGVGSRVDFRDDRSLDVRIHVQLHVNVDRRADRTMRSELAGMDARRAVLRPRFPPRQPGGSSEGVRSIASTDLSTSRPPRRLPGHVPSIDGRASVHAPSTGHPSPPTSIRLIRPHTGSGHLSR